MAHKRKTVVFLGDGMADEPLPQLGNRTPLQYANTPAMDSIARDGVCGTMLTLPAGYPTSSEVANMSVLGCDLSTEYCGRGPLEAAGRNIPLGPSDKAFRMNLTTVAGGVLKDFSGGHVRQEDAQALIAAVNKHFGAPDVRFYPGLSYRSILVLSGPKYSHRVATEKPDDNHGEAMEDHLPKAQCPEAEATAALLRRIMLEAPAVLGETAVNRKLREAGRPMANGVWPWSGGLAGGLKPLTAKYGASGAVISAVDVIVGLGRLLGMSVINVPGATGYIDTNYEGKADAAIAALRNHDFVYLHLEAIDEVSHEQNLDLKVRAIENFDQRIIQRVLDAAGDSINVAVLPDHPVPIAFGKHTRTPVPVAVRMRGVAPDQVQTFDELSCQHGRLGMLKGDDLMNLLLGQNRA
jgi:2,3-bisphosphoglycerate-independent phosphoglycerate mutase